MKWTLDHTYDSGRLEQEVDCSLGYHEFIQAMQRGPDGQLLSMGSTYSAVKSLWEGRGLDAARFNELRAASGCPETHTLCSDADAVFEDGATTCMSRTCRCVPQTRKGIQTQSSNISEVKPEVDPVKILGVTALGISALLLLQFWSE
jgi:hypothetical protein